MTFDEALKCLREGKKVRISTWATECNIELKEDRFVYPSGATYSLDTHDILSNWWEICSIISHEIQTKINQLLTVFRARFGYDPTTIYIPSAVEIKGLFYNNIPVKATVEKEVYVEGKAEWYRNIVYTLRYKNV